MYAAYVDAYLEQEQTALEELGDATTSSAGAMKQLCIVAAARLHVLGVTSFVPSLSSTRPRWTTNRPKKGLRVELTRST